MNQEPFITPPPATSSVMDRLEDGLLPLINVVFLLLMFFLIAGIIMQDSLPPLPTAAQAESRRESALDLTIGADGRLQIQGETVAAESLAERLPDFDPDNRLRVGAHRDLSMADLERRFADLAEAGHPEVVLLTDQDL